MKGRVLTAKKSIVLYVFAAIMLFSFVVLSTLSFVVFKRPKLWFFSFCLCFGLYELLRSILLSIDNSLYLGSLLVGIGIAGFVIDFADLQRYAPILIAMAFAIASFLVFVFYRQSFHLVLSFSLIFVTIYAYLLTKNLITFGIFIAFVSSFLVILILTAIFQIRWRK